MDYHGFVRVIQTSGCLAFALNETKRHKTTWPIRLDWSRDIGRFYTKDALSVQTNLGKHFVVRLVMRLKYKDGHKTHYESRRNTFRSASFKTYFEGKFVKRSTRSTSRY